MAAKKRHQVSNQENGRSKSSVQTPVRSKTGKHKENGHGAIKDNSKQDSKLPGIGYILLVTSIAALCGILHRSHIAGMFESDRHFSHLSTLERELAFRTEMGLYYSYYKTLIEASSLSSGLNQIMYDNVTEHPLTINTLKRFNLYPEVVVGTAFRVFTAITEHLQIPTKQCWKTNRGEGLSPVWSCEGIGDPAYFYVESVFTLNGLGMALFFLFGVYLSGSVLGGVLAVLSFFYNHGECTRVQWTPPLRESFAYPFFVLQMFILTVILRCPRPSLVHVISLALATVCFMLNWQFAQFALLTQTVAVFACYVLLFIGSHKMFIVLAGQALGLFISFIFLFGNEMLLASFFTAALATIAIIVALEPLLEKIRIRFFIWVSQGLLLLGGTVAIKLLTSRVLHIADDAHIGDIFRSKFTSFKNFHTMLYTCAVEFNFMEKETPVRVLKTLLAPCAIAAISVITVKLCRRELALWLKQTMVVEGNNNTTEQVPQQVERKYRSKPHAELVYHGFQLLAFTAMAVLIMRLKLFWTPHLCLATAMLASREFFSFVGSPGRHGAVVAAVIAAMSVQGYANLQHQWSIMGEFSNYPLEELVEWINAKTPQHAVFGGPMPTMATVKLCTGRPIVNHPHYEDAGLRERTKMIYAMYSRKPAEQVWKNVRSLGVDYAILEESWCTRRSRRGCGMAEIWDLEDEANQGKPATCTLLKQDPAPYFRRVFRNQIYDVLQVLHNPHV